MRNESGEMAFNQSCDGACILGGGGSVAVGQTTMLVFPTFSSWLQVGIDMMTNKPPRETHRSIDIVRYVNSMSSARQSRVKSK